jgi:hypothetical protein
MTLPENSTANTSLHVDLMEIEMSRGKQHYGKESTEAKFLHSPKP